MSGLTDTWVRPQEKYGGSFWRCFLRLKKGSPVTLIVSYLAAMVFTPETPKGFCGLKHFPHPSISIVVSKYRVNFHFSVNYPFKGHWLVEMILTDAQCPKCVHSQTVGFPLAMCCITLQHVLPPHSPADLPSLHTLTINSNTYQKLLGQIQFIKFTLCCLWDTFFFFFKYWKKSRARHLPHTARDQMCTARTSDSSYSWSE